MRELTSEEIDAVSGAGFLGDLWGAISHALTASADFLGFDGRFGAGGGSGGFFGAVGNLFGADSRGYVLIGEAGVGHEDGVETEARRQFEEAFGQGFAAASGASGIGAELSAQAAGTQYAHSTVNAVDFFSQFMALGTHNLGEAYLRGSALSNGIPTGEISLSDPHYSLTDPQLQP